MCAQVHHMFCGHCYRWRVIQVLHVDLVLTVAV